MEVINQEMEVINQGSNDINEMASLSCCWPPGTMGMQYPEPQ